MFLEVEEIKKLTGKARKAQQKQVLNAMRIRYEVNGIGEIVISRSHVEHRLGGSDRPEHDGAQPDFSGLSKAQ